MKLLSEKPQSTGPGQLENRLLAYVMVGAGVAAIAPSANAQIVYTSTHETISHGGVLQIDLNNDAVNDFTISQRVYTSFYYRGFLGVSGDQNIGTGVIGGNKPVPLPYGAPIGPASPRRFIPAQSQSLSMAYGGTFVGSCFAFGHWANVVHRFLGLRFNIGGQVHYGWARLSVSTCTTGGGSTPMSVSLNGYAYETQPDKTIQAGETGLAADLGTFDGSPAKPRVESQSLGLLSLGSMGLEMWRKQ